MSLSNTWIFSISIQTLERGRRGHRGKREAKNRADDDEDEADNEMMMDISETKKCYVYGQCQVRRDSSFDSFCQKIQ